MNARNNRSFATGLACGIALTIAASLLMGHALGNDDEGASEPFPMQFFVTGDTRNGTLWRVEPDGTLACISRNWCEAPVYPPADERVRPPRDADEEVDEGRVPRGPRVPTGPRTPTGPSVP